MQFAFFETALRAQKSYSRLMEPVCKKWNLTHNELDVLLFLANHPAHDTARDVTELRGLAKSQVSAAVDLLAARELLRRQPDKADRRVIHLALTDAGAALAREGQKLQSTCLDALFAGLTQSEAERFQELLEKVLTSAEVRLKEGGNT